MKTRREWLIEAISRFVRYQDVITWFGNGGVGKSFLEVVSTLAEVTSDTAVALVRRFTLLAATGPDLVDVAAERGAEKLGGTRARLLIIVRPVAANVAAINVGGGIAGSDRVEVDSSDGFAVGMSVRIRNDDGTITEIATVAAVPDDTHVDVSTLVGAYSPGSDNVDLLARVTIPPGTTVTTRSGATFQTVNEVTTGDRNPLLAGASQNVGLADAVWCECTEEGESGNVEPRDVLDFDPAVDGVRAVLNPEPGWGGEDEESDHNLKYRAAHGPTQYNQETLAWLETVAVQANSNVLRAVPAESSDIGVMGIAVLHRNGGAFSSTDLTAIGTYLGARRRSYMSVAAENITLTSIEIDAVVTPEANHTLEDLGIAASDALATYLDHRRWPFGKSVSASELYDLIKDTTGVSAVDLPTFSPAVDVEVEETSLPTLVRLSLTHKTTGETWNADLTVRYPEA